MSKTNSIQVLYLELVIFADKIIFPAVLLMIVREEEHILCHALNMRVVFYAIVVLKPRVQRHSAEVIGLNECRSIVQVRRWHTAQGPRPPDACVVVH